MNVLAPNLDRIMPSQLIDAKVQLSPANFNGGQFLSWRSDDPSELDLLATVERLAEIRSLYLNHLITDFFTGSIDTQTKRKDIAWFR